MDERQIYEYLKENGIYAEVFTDINKQVCVEIELGDWKHEHGYCDHLMSEKGFMFVGEKVTYENGGDCYSSIHYYIN